MKPRTQLFLLISVFALVACATDSIDDRRTGQLMVCHKDDKTLTVSNADSFVHLNHGDTLGPCPEVSTDG